MRRFGLATAFLMGSALTAFATGTTWDELSYDLYGDRTLNDGSHVIAIDAPYRTTDDARTQIAAQVLAPGGMKIKAVTVVLDENPMPVSAVFNMSDPLPSFYFDVTMRVNGPTPLHVVVETTDGELWVAETFVKTSGLGACSAPPGTDPELALATLGEMEIVVDGAVPELRAGSAAALNRWNKLDLDITHPSHSGMQMDQISLLFIPMRYVENVDIDLDGSGYVDVTGSISVSENPRMSVSVPRNSQSVDVTIVDTDGTISKAQKKLAGF